MEDPIVYQSIIGAQQYLTIIRHGVSYIVRII